MGEDIYVPHGNSYYGMRWKILDSKMKRSGDEWSSDSELVEAWTLYWEELKISIDRKNYFNNRVR
jgi:hypothetical protein